MLYSFLNGLIIGFEFRAHAFTHAIVGVPHLAFEEDYVVLDAIIASLCNVHTTLACARVGQNASLDGDN